MINPKFRHATSYVYNTDFWQEYGHGPCPILIRICWKKNRDKVVLCIFLYWSHKYNFKCKIYSRPGATTSLEFRQNAVNLCLIVSHPAPSDSGSE